MMFKLQPEDNVWPNIDELLLSYGLSIYIPKSLNYEILNYGQGEGQALIEGYEWGFYYSDDEGIDLVLHDDSCPQKTALLVARMIADHFDEILGKPVNLMLK